MNLPFRPCGSAGSLPKNSDHENSGHCTSETSSRWPLSLSGSTSARSLPLLCDEGDLLRLGFGLVLPMPHRQPLGSLAWAETDSTDSASSSSQLTTLWAKASLTASACGALQ